MSDFVGNTEEWTNKALCAKAETLIYAYWPKGVQDVDPHFSATQFSSNQVFHLCILQPIKRSNWKQCVKMNFVSSVDMMRS